MQDPIIAVVMAGGMGGRLRPLTDVRAKPAVPFGGAYRIIDFTLSNCINSGIRRIFVLTQYKSHSLSNHLKAGWNFLSRRLGQFIDEVPAQMQIGSGWYRGTADAIRQNLSLLHDSNCDKVLVLAGDHIYKMDYRHMSSWHMDHGAALTISVLRMASESARNFGVLEIDDQGRVTSFEEKPEHPKTLPGSDDCLISMGVYLFDRERLIANLDDTAVDFGKDLIPRMIARGEPVWAFDFQTRNVIPEYEYVTVDGMRHRTLVNNASDAAYWRDVGTLEAFWAANLDLVATRPRFNLYGEKWPIFNNPGHFPPAKFVHETGERVGHAVNSIVCDGVIVSGARVSRSVLASGIYVHSYTTIDTSVLLGGAMDGGILQETAIGRGCRIRNAIIDKNVEIRADTVLGYDRAQDERRGLTTVPLSGSDDHIVVVPKNAVI